MPEEELYEDALEMVELMEVTECAEELDWIELVDVDEATELVEPIERIDMLETMEESLVSPESLSSPELEEEEEESVLASACVRRQSCIWENETLMLHFPKREMDSWEVARQEGRRGQSPTSSRL
jgi:hypothetical protein